MSSSENMKSFVPRITQLDSLFLNDEAYSLLKNQLLTAVKYFGQAFVTKLEPEIDAALNYIILKYTVQKARSSVGQQLLQIKYEDSLPRAKLQRYVFSLVFGKWAQLRFGDVVHVVTRNESAKLKASQCVNFLEIFFRISEFFNLLLFLHQGLYPSVLERVLGMRLVSSQPGTIRKISYVYFTRELLWHGFAELLAFVLPLINIQYFHHVVRKLLPSSGEDDGSDNEIHVNFQQETTCVVCNNFPILPHCFGCQHIACYFCINSSYSLESTFVCPLCGHRIENQVQIVPAFIS